MTDTTLFRGYVPTKNKNCTMKFGNGEPLLTLEEVSAYDEYAGILAYDTILIDIDDQEQSEILMRMVEDMQLDCKVIQTTRGRHFYFKNTDIEKCKTHTHLACGLVADIKVGRKNSYAVLKFNGEERFTEWDVEEGTGYQTLPSFLRPVKSRIDLMNLAEGDGRNEALFSYILDLAKAGFSMDESRKILKLTNDYIFKNPLSDDELNTICRDEAFPTDLFMEDGKFLHDKFGQFLIKDNGIKRINGTLHIYNNGVYVSSQRLIEGAMIRKMPSIKAQQRTEVLKYVDIVAEDGQMADARYIAFQNGVYDIISDQMSEFSKDMVVTNMIPWKYNPQAYDKITDRTLYKIACNDQSIRCLLEEMIGYCMYRRNEMSKAFMLTGEKANGKTTFLEMLCTLFGKQNVSNLELVELSERFSVAELAGKLVNIGDDISDKFVEGDAVAKFKKIVSGSAIKGELKGERVFFFEPYVKLLFSANDIPRMKDKTGAVLRRLVIVPFNAKFSVEDPDYDPYIKYKLQTESAMQYLIVIGIRGLKRVLATKDFSNSKKVDKAIEEYNIENNPILSFIRDIGESEIINQPTAEVYRRYKMYCLENGFSEMTKIGFSRGICREMKLETKQIRVENKKIIIFVRII